MRNAEFRRSGRLAAAIAVAMGFAAPSAATAQILDNLTAPLKRIFEAGAPKPSEPLPIDNTLECPRVEVIYGGAALRVFSPGGAESGALRHQVSLVESASECRLAPDGGVVARVALVGRALLGPTGSPGTITAPVTVLIKRGATVVARRARVVSVAIPPGGQQAAFSFVEEDIAVPAGGEFSIEAGVGNFEGGPAEQKPKAKAKRR